MDSTGVALVWSYLGLGGGHQGVEYALAGDKVFARDT